MELNLHGVSCAVIEPRPDVNWLRPRAKTVSARTMEHFRRWGLAEELRKKAPLKVRPDQHVSWSGPPPADPHALTRTAVGWAG